MVWYWYKDRKINEETVSKNRLIIHSNHFYNKDVTAMWGGDFFQHMILDQLHIHHRKR